MKPKFKVKVSYFSSDSCLHDFNRKQEGNWSRFCFSRHKPVYSTAQMKTMKNCGKKRSQIFPRPVATIGLKVITISPNIIMLKYALSFQENIPVVCTADVEQRFFQDVLSSLIDQIRHYIVRSLNTAIFFVDDTLPVKAKTWGILGHWSLIFWEV